MKALSDFRQKVDPLQAKCPVRAALDVVQGRWKPSILYELNSGPKRYHELKAALAGATAQALTVQLRQLEADGVVKRTVYPEIPARVEYALTKPGTALATMLDRLEQWGRDFLSARNTELPRRRLG